MKKLFKEADHDVYNRDSAIVYAGGKFYLGGTHSICLKKIKDDNPEIKTVLKSFLYRADVEQFQEISKHVGTVILAHLAKKEDGVFIDFGIIDGEYKDFDGIPDQYKKEFEAEFNMKTYDEMKHDMDIIEYPESNPYRYDIQNIDKNLDEELDKLNDPTKAEEYLKQSGFEDKGLGWLNEDNTIFVFLKDAIAKVCSIGEEEIECQIDKLPEAMSQVRTDVLDRIKQYNPKNLKCEFHNYRFILNFQNNNDINIKIAINKPNEYKVINPFDLMKDFTQRQFGHDTVEECMEYIMNWSPEENTEAKMKRLLKKAYHDVVNRDDAIVYAGGKFYTGVTHSICLKQILEDNPKINTLLENYRCRVDIEKFQEISKHVGTVILAHLVSKEDGVFIDFGIIDGEYKDFDGIPDQYKKEFEAEFGMKAYDEMKHDVDIRKNPELNPYKDDKKEIADRFYQELNDASDSSEVEDQLIQQGYNQDGPYWINKNRTISVIFDGIVAYIKPFGEETIKCQLNKVLETLKNVNPTILDKFKKYNAKEFSSYFDGMDSFVDFKNNQGITITIDLSIANNYTITPKALGEELTGLFNSQTIEEYMEYIMNWSPEENTEAQMKHLLKKADHDVYNRDSAIVYAGGKFYTGGTHSICLKKIKDDNPEIKTVLRSFQYRADFEQFQEISNHVGTVIIAHLAKKEDGVFIDFGIIDGDFKYYDDIPDKYKKEFEDEFGMKTYDEMKHDVDIHKNPELNPYNNDTGEINKRVKKELDELSDPTNAEEYLEKSGYENLGLYWINKDETIAVFLEDAYAEIYVIGEEEFKCQIDKLPEGMKDLKTSVLDRIKQYNPKDLECNFYDFEFEISFKNNKGIDIEIKMENHYNYKVSYSDLASDLPCDQFGRDTLDECMEVIMDWEPRPDKKNLSELRDILGNYLCMYAYDYKISDYEYLKESHQYRFDITETGPSGRISDEYSLFVDVYTGEITNINGDPVGKEDDDLDLDLDNDTDDIWRDLELDF